MLRLTFAATSALLVAACASGPPLLLGQPIQQEVAIHVHVSAEAAKTDDLGGTAAIVETVSEELADRGVKYQLFLSDDDKPPAPRIEIWVQKWDDGDRSERYGMGVAFGVVGQALASQGGYAVVCRVYREGEAKAALEHTYSGSILDTTETASSSAGESVGNSIVRDVLGNGPPPERDDPR